MQIIGFTLLIGSQFAAGTMFIVEEKLLGNYYLQPLFIVGWEGVWGVCFYVVFLFIGQFITFNGGVADPTKDLFPYG